MSGAIIVDANGNVIGGDAAVGSKVITHPSAVQGGAPTSYITPSLTAPIAQQQAPGFSTNNLDYAQFGQAAGPTIAFSASNPNAFAGTYSLNGYTVQFGGTLPTEAGYQSEQQRINEAVDMAYQALNNLQVQRPPDTATNIQPITIDLDELTPGNQNAISGGSYQVPGTAVTQISGPSPQSIAQYVSGLISGSAYATPITQTPTITLTPAQQEQVNRGLAAAGYASPENAGVQSVAQYLAGQQQQAHKRQTYKPIVDISAQGYGCE